MNVLLLGCGRQGRAVAHDLVRQSDLGRLVCADADARAAQALVDRVADARLAARAVDAGDAQALHGLIGGGFDVVVDMLPRQFIPEVVAAAIPAGAHVVNTYYAQGLERFAEAAVDAGVALLPEMGFDPGIDLVLCGEAVRRLDVVERLLSYGGGIPAPGDDDNPLRYRISWTWEGVLNSYDRPARQILDGESIDIPADEIFAAPHTLEVPPLGELEAFPNGDARRYVEQLGLSDVRDAGRFALRWPGHCALWYPLVRLGFLATDEVDGLGVSPREFMVRHLEPRLQYADDQRDLAVLVVEVAGRRGGKSARVRFKMIDERDPATGLLAMNRAVGYPASIAAQMLVRGEIGARGLLQPARDVPYAPFVEALAARGFALREVDESA